MTLGIQTHKLPANVLYPFVKVVIFVLLLIAGQVNLKLSYWNTVNTVSPRTNTTELFSPTPGPREIDPKASPDNCIVTQVSRCGVVGDASPWCGLTLTRIAVARGKHCIGHNSEMS